MPHKLLDYTPELYQYVVDKNPAISPLLAELHAKTLAQTGGHMVIPFDQMHFMQFLLKLLRVEKVLELGTFTGFSALAFALALPASGSVTTIDIASDTVELGKPYWQQAGVADKICFRQGKALALLQADVAAKATYDFIFIDADKGNIPEYVELSLKLLSDRGVVLVDNTLFSGHVVDADNERKIVCDVRAFNDWLIAQKGCQYCLLPIGDGLTMICPS